jgi:hypothetical protein
MQALQTEASVLENCKKLEAGSQDTKARLPAHTTQIFTTGHTEGRGKYTENTEQHYHKPFNLLSLKNTIFNSSLIMKPHRIFCLSFDSELTTHDS